MSDTNVGVWVPSIEKSEKITLTHAALAHIKKTIAKQGKGVGIHFGVKKKGCSGFGYHVEIIEQSNPDDIIFSAEDIIIAVDKASFTYVQGTQIDYLKEGLMGHFQFNNPNEKASCGCGESFSVD